MRKQPVLVLAKLVKGQTVVLAQLVAIDNVQL